MSQHHRTPKTVYFTLAAGIAIGAFSMAGIGKGIGVSAAHAKPPSILPTLGQARTVSLPTNSTLEALASLDDAMASLAEFTAPAVVHITSVKTRGSGPNADRPISGGQGSGFILSKDGWIVTNDHVVGGFDKVTVILKDGREFNGTVRSAADSDIALVKIDAKDLHTLEFADSDKVRPGQISMAIGAPFGLEQSVTVGHVSALGRMNAIQDKLYPDLIQTDTSINMGNSGGPLVNIYGQVIGINTAIFSPTGVSAGIGFAIPSNQARLIADILIKDGKLTRSMMKLVPENLKEYQKKEMGLSGGALVSNVQVDGPAAAAGIKEGDVIVRIGDIPVNDQLDLRNAMLVHRPGTTVPVELVRNGKKVTVSVKLVAHELPKVATARPMPGQRRPEGAPGMPFPHDFGDLREWFRDMPGTDGPPAPTEKDVPSISDQPRLGVTVDTADANARNQFKLPENARGAVVTSVQPGSIAANNGLKVGDLITSFGGKEIRSAQDLINAVRASKQGDQKRLSFTRYGDGQVMNTTLDITFR